MRAGLTTIQQTLTPEAAGVLNQAISEAGRRSHGQTTPLHVAATLLSSPAGLLRQACVKSHPNSSHPLQCRALELCFSIALERLPAGQNLASGGDPPISNALMAALKRAQAQQRRGCPEQQQQPLLAVKVELEQLIVSILDDPSVSRVMREASFSSPAVKASIEQSLLSSSNHSSSSSSFIPNFSFRPVAPLPAPVPGGRNIYVNPRFQKACPNGGGNQLGKEGIDEVKKVIDIMSRARKRNPILVGESEAEQVVKEVLRRKEGWKIFHLEKEVLDKSDISEKIGEIVESSIRNLGTASGIIVDVGDLKWLVEQPSCFVAPSGSAVNGIRGIVTEAGRAAVTAVGKVVGNPGLSSKVWLIGTATCDTYLRCQVYYPTMEADWDLQAVPIAAKTPIAVDFRLPPSRHASSEKVVTPPKTMDSGGSNKCCSQCKENYEQEVQEINSKPVTDNPQANLPQWLRKATSDDSKEQKILELQEKWREKCFQIHSDRSFQKDHPVTTDLALGCPKVNDDFVGLDQHLKLLEASANKLSSSFDVDFVKKILKGMLEADSWQQDAATAVASAITRCRLGNGKRRRGDIWLLFSGPDKGGKKRIASAISDLVCGALPTAVSLKSKRDNEKSKFSVRGKTALDHIVDAVKRNPFSVVLLEDIDDGDVLLINNIKRAMNRGRISDSHGREISLGNIIFILTASWLPDDFPLPAEGEKKIAGFRNGDWQLRISLSEKTAKRHARWLLDDRPIKQKKELKSGGLQFDLNEAADEEDNRADASRNSSDLTFECEDEHTIIKNRFIFPANSSFSRELLSHVDENIVFKPVDHHALRDEIASFINKKISSTIGDKILVELKEEALERIVCGVWLGWIELEEWWERALCPIIHRLQVRIPSDTDSLVVRLELDNDSASCRKEEAPPRRSIGVCSGDF